ncbi:MAG: NAD-dependent epimerase/dehydratase family protein, partial [Polyangiaceae bacterium]|nr:NAD-dependent epimerase/dehydratase family protein [Polyangiaceae bacterium]
DPQNRRSQTQSENLKTFQHLLEIAIEFQIPKIVLLSSANAYGPRPENAQFLKETAPLLGSGRFSEMRALVELDLYAQSQFWRSPETELVILRPANIVGTVHNAPSNFLRLARVPTLMGFDPMLQVVHQDDVVQALERALTPGIRGIFNIAGPPPAPLSEILHRLKRATLPIPYTLAKGGLGSLFKVGLTKFPAAELDFIRFVCMVDDSHARAKLDYEPVFGLSETLREVDRLRWGSS